MTKSKLLFTRPCQTKEARPSNETHPNFIQASWLRGSLSIAGDRTSSSMACPEPCYDQPAPEAGRNAERWSHPGQLQVSKQYSVYWLWNSRYNSTWKMPSVPQDTRSQNLDVWVSIMLQTLIFYILLQTAVTQGCLPLRRRQTINPAVAGGCIIWFYGQCLSVAGFSSLEVSGNFPGWKLLSFSWCCYLPEKTRMYPFTGDFWGDSSCQTSSREGEYNSWKKLAIILSGKTSMWMLEHPRQVQLHCSPISLVRSSVYYTCCYC